MKFNKDRWYRITDSIDQNTFIFIDKVISDTEVVFDCEIYNFEGLYLRDCTVKYWEPHEGEYCWFINFKEYDNPVLGKFGGLSPDGPYMQGKLFHKEFDEIEPFREDLPYYLKLKDYVEEHNDMLKQRLKNE